MIIIKWTHCVWMHLLSRLQCDIHFHITIGICFCLISFHSSRAGKKEKKSIFVKYQNLRQLMNEHILIFFNSWIAQRLYTQKNWIFTNFTNLSSFSNRNQNKKASSRFWVFKYIYSNYFDEVIDSRYLWKHCMKTKTIDNLEASRKF